MLLKREWVRDASLGGNVMMPKLNTVLNVTTYDCALSDPFSLQEDIKNCVKWDVIARSDLYCFSQRTNDNIMFTFGVTTSLAIYN